MKASLLATAVIIATQLTGYSQESKPNEGQASSRQAEKLEPTIDHVLLLAKWPEVQDNTRFLVFQKPDGIHFAHDVGFFGGFVKDDGYSRHGRIFSIGAIYVIKDTVDGFLGYRFESDSAFPLCFQSEKTGLRYLCGRGSVKTPDWRKIDFTQGSTDEWISKLRQGSTIERRAAAQALGWIGTAKEQAELLGALSDGDFIVRGLAAEALMRIGDTKAIQPLQKAKEEAERQLKELSTITTGNGMMLVDLDVVAKPFSSWDDAIFIVSARGEVHEERTANQLWLQSIYETAIKTIESRAKR